MDSPDPPSQDDSEDNGVAAPAAAAPILTPQPAVAGEGTVDPGRLVRLASPSLSGVVRIVLMVTVCAIGVYLAWRVRGVIRLVGISLFFALALMPIVDAIDGRIRVPCGPVISWASTSF